VADAVARETTPTVVRESFGVITVGNLAQQIGNVFAVVGAVDAGDEQIASAMGFAI
jgi:hypothetical protein